MHSISQLFRAKVFLPPAKESSSSLTEGLLAEEKSSSGVKKMKSSHMYQEMNPKYLLPEDGFNTFIDAKGNKISGVWENYEIKTGKIEYRNGFKYDGEIKFNKPEGRGTIEVSRESRTLQALQDRTKSPIFSMTGSWHDGKLNYDKPIEIKYLDGSRYIGKSQNGVPHGEGKMIVKTDEINFDKSSSTTRVCLIEETQGNWINGELIGEPIIRKY